MSDLLYTPYVNASGLARHFYLNCQRSSYRLRYAIFSTYSSNIWQCMLRTPNIDSQKRTHSVAAIVIFWSFILYIAYLAIISLAFLIFDHHEIVEWFTRLYPDAFLV